MTILIAAVLCGPAATFEYPIFLAVGPDRSIYVSDQDAPAILRIAPDGKVQTLFQAKKQFRTPLYRPRGIAVDAKGIVYVCDPATMDVYRITPDGKAEGLTGVAIKELNGKPGVRGMFVQPEGVAVASDGTVYVSDLRMGEISKLKPGSKKPELVAKVAAPHGMLVDKDGTLVVVSHGESHLRRVDPKDCKVTDVFAGHLPKRKYGPFVLSVALRPDGSYLVTDNYNRCLWAVSRDGKAEVLVENDPLVKVTGVGVDAKGNIAIADPANRKVFWLSPEKKFAVAAGP